MGGIYTVLRTKSQAVVDRYGANYVLIGPDEREKANLEFEEQAPPPFFAEALRELFDRKLCRWGRWLVPGEPQTILLTVQRTPEELNADKALLWQHFSISSLQPDSLVDQAVAFGSVVAEVVLRISRAHRDLVMFHAHEWLAGTAILGCVEKKPDNLKTIFTTHATLIGRYEAGNNPRFYRQIQEINPEERARHYNISARHGIERASAQACDLFTTVSDVTAQEAKLFLGRSAEAILPNGLNAHRFAALHEFQNLHLKYKTRINQFIIGHFFPSYTFDLERTLYMFVSGRYEYRNKGMDIFVDSLAQLRDRLRRVPDPPTVVAFIVTRADTANLRADALEGQLMFHDLKRLTDELNAVISERLLECILKRRAPTAEELLPADASTRIKRASYAFMRKSEPPVVTHKLVNEELDPVIAHFRRRGFTNAENDPVKVIFHPEFVTATSPLFGLEYDQFVRGCHIGVFPSYYEPWGYTPLECIALGIPTVTTDLSGFGSFVQNTIPNAWEQGIIVLNRSTKDDGEVVTDLATSLFQFAQMSRRQRIDLRNRAERLTETFDWSSLSSYYFSAYQRLERGH